MAGIGDWKLVIGVRAYRWQPASVGRANAGRLPALWVKPFIGGATRPCGALFCDRRDVQTRQGRRVPPRGAVRIVISRKRSGRTENVSESGISSLRIGNSPAART